MSLKQIIPKGFYLGATSDYQTLSRDSRLQELVKANFNLITSDRDFKITTIARTPDQWDFSGSDWFVDFANKYDLKLRGHLMVWFRSLPDWLKEMETYQFKRFLKEYIQATLTRYPSITDWDICGEAIDDTGKIRESLLSFHLGDDWVKTCLIWAREAAPNAKLFYSEFKLQNEVKQQPVLRIIDDCLEEGPIIDGIAIQLHHNSLGGLKLFPLKEFIEQVKYRGLTNHFSEITFWSKRGKQNDFVAILQATAYRELLRFCLIHDIEVFNIWGITDLYSWR